LCFIGLVFTKRAHKCALMMGRVAMDEKLLQARQDNNLLYDFYGSLLTAKQRHVFEMHALHDCSFSEIAQEMGITPQAVADNIKRTRAQLNKYEQNLGMVQKLQVQQELLQEIDTELAKLETNGIAINIRASLNKLLI